MGWNPGGKSKWWFGGNGLKCCGCRNGEWGKWGKASGRGRKASLGGVRGLSGGRHWVIRAFSSSLGDDPLRCESGDPEQLTLYSSRPRRASSSLVLGRASPGKRCGGNGGARCGDCGTLGGDCDWAACCCSCSKQCILNQLERRPYLEPDLDIPTMRHLRSRHALHAVRFFLLMTHSPLFLHSVMEFRLL